MRTIPDIVRELSAGLTAPQLALLVELVSVATLSRDMSRTYERDRKRQYRRNTVKSGAKQTMRAPKQAEIVPGHVPDFAENHCQLTSFLPSLSSVESGTQSRKKEGVRARGTRMEPGTLISDPGRQFAIDNGVDPDRHWPEFVDYWIGVPGNRGLKLNWSATWRNRVRDLAGRQQNGHGNSPNHQNGAATSDPLLAGLGRIAARIADRQLAAAGRGPERAEPEDPDTAPEFELIGPAPDRP